MTSTPDPHVLKSAPKGHRWAGQSPDPPHSNAPSGLCAVYGVYSVEHCAYVGLSAGLDELSNYAAVAKVSFVGCP
jgi:hypothetical protein